MKKVTAVFLTVLLILTLTACGSGRGSVSESENGDAQVAAGSEQTADGSTGTTASGEGRKVGVLLRTFSDTYTTTVRTYMSQYLEEAGYAYEVMDANDSQATQNEQ